MADLGLMGMNIPAEYGGSQAGVVSYSLAMTEIGKACASTAVTMAVTNMVAEMIHSFGNEEARRAHIPKLCQGEYSGGAFALTESTAGSDSASMKSSAAKEGDHYVLNGSKTFITNAEFAGIFVVWAKTDKGSRSPGDQRFPRGKRTSRVGGGPKRREDGPARFQYQ